MIAQVRDSIGARRRALTLLEMLIAIGVLLGLAALALPVVWNSLSRREFDAAVDSVCGQMRLARAHAQRTGQSVMVEYDPQSSRVVAKVLDFASARGEDGSRASSGADKSPVRMPRDAARRFNDRSPSGTIDQNDDDDGSDRITESWAEVEIDSDISVLTALPDAAPSAGADGSDHGVGPEEADSLPSEIGHAKSDLQNHGAGSRSNESVRLVVFLPDGTAAMRTDIWIEGADRHLASLRVNAWTGEPLIEPVVSADASNDPKSEEKIHDSDDKKKESRTGDTSKAESESAVEPVSGEKEPGGKP